MFCSAQKIMKLLPSCDNLGGHRPTTGTYGFTPHFHHPSRWDREIVRGVVGGLAEANEQQVLPARQAGEPFTIKAIERV
jgi:hypothetical protein